MTNCLFDEYDIASGAGVLPLNHFLSPALRLRVCLFPYNPSFFTMVAHSSKRNVTFGVLERHSAGKSKTKNGLSASLAVESLN